MSTTLNKKDGVLSLLMLTGMPSARVLYTGIEGEDREEMYNSHKVMSRDVGVKKPQDAPEGKSLVGHESCQRQKGRVL